MYVLAVGLDPVELRSFEEDDPPFRFDYETFQIGTLLSDGLEQSGDLLLVIVSLAAVSKFLVNSRHGLIETKLVERLQQVIERCGFECPNSVLLVRGNKDDLRQSGRAKSLKCREAVYLRHLHVEENKVRLFL